MRFMEALGTILGYVVMAIWIVAISIVNLYILARYGLFVWLFAIPISLSLIWAAFSLGVLLVTSLVGAIARGLGALFGGRHGGEDGGAAADGEPPRDGAA